MLEETGTLYGIPHLDRPDPFEVLPVAVQEQKQQVQQVVESDVEPVQYYQQPVMHVGVSGTTEADQASPNTAESTENTSPASPEDVYAALERRIREHGYIVFDMDTLRWKEINYGMHERPEKYKQPEILPFIVRMYSHTVANILVHKLRSPHAAAIYEQITGLDIDGLTFPEPAKPELFDDLGSMSWTHLQQIIYEVTGRRPWARLSYDVVSSSLFMQPFELYPPKWPDEAKDGQEQKKPPEWKPKTRTYADIHGRNMGAFAIYEDPWS